MTERMSPRPTTIRCKQAARGRSAFTLVELMVALTVGGVALGSIYAVGAHASRHFREQQRIATTQSSVRMAMDIIKKDFQRAGFLASPNANFPSERCGGVAPDSSLLPNGTQLSAISAYIDDVIPHNPVLPTFVDPTTSKLNSPFIALDNVTLLGNYTTTAEYPISLIDSNKKAKVQQGSQSFHRDFYSPSTGLYDNNSFLEAFPVGRLVRVHTESDAVFFTTVSGNTIAPSSPTDELQLPLTLAPPPSCPTAKGWIAPVNKIQYHVAAPAASEEERFPQGTSIRTIGILKRTEVDPTATPGADQSIAALASADDNRSVLDYVVNFNLRFLMRDPSVPQNSVVWVPATALQVVTNPERVLGVIIDLAARTPEQEASVFFQNTLVSFPGDGLRTFKLFEGQAGAARVRTAHAELFLPNIAFRGY